MSTRCQIGFYPKGTPLNQPSILVYKHSDGYPSYTLDRIVTFCQVFQQHRGMYDLEYLSAQLLANLIHESHQSADQFFSEPDNYLPKHYCPKFQFTGYGICPKNDFHWDIAYYYAIYDDGTIGVYEPHKVEYQDDGNHALDYRKLASFRISKTGKVVAVKISKRAEQKDEIKEVLSP